jgi:hypothetical protein
MFTRLVVGLEIFRHLLSPEGVAHWRSRFSLRKYFKCGVRAPLTDATRADQGRDGISDLGIHTFDRVTISLEVF